MDVSLSFSMSLSSPADKPPEHIWFVLSLTLSEINGELTHVGQQKEGRKSCYKLCYSSGGLQISIDRCYCLMNIVTGLLEIDFMSNFH